VKKIAILQSRGIGKSKAMWTVTEVMGVAGGEKEVVVENMEGIGGNGEKESRVSSRGEINNAW